MDQLVEQERLGIKVLQKELVEILMEINDKLEQQQQPQQKQQQEEEEQGDEENEVVRIEPEKCAVTTSEREKAEDLESIFQGEGRSGAQQELSLIHI